MKLFVWDFHGVLEKGNEYGVLEITNTILKKFGYKKRMTESQCRKMYGLKWYQYFEQLLPKEPLAKHLELQEACFFFSTNHPEVVAKNIKPNDHVVEVVESIAKSHQQIVISNTKPDSLEMFLKSVSLDKFFLPDNAFAADAHGKDATTKKHHLLTKFLSDKKFDSYVYIGDSPEDIELVTLTGGKTYLYAHPGKTHKPAKADYMITDLREILKEV
jgi:phosphoglycolate phosphatase-like HAD superfamily hydrolase